MIAPTAETPQAFDPAHFVRVRWLIYAILAAAYILVFFHRIAPAVVSADLMQAFGAVSYTHLGRRGQRPGRARAGGECADQPVPEPRQWPGWAGAVAVVC